MLNKVKKRLNSVNMLYTETAVNHGTKLTLAVGVSVIVFTTGRVVVQGMTDTKKNVEKLLGLNV